MASHESTSARPGSDYPVTDGAASFTRTRAFLFAGTHGRKRSPATGTTGVGADCRPRARRGPA